MELFKWKTILLIFASFVAVYGTALNIFLQTVDTEELQKYLDARTYNYILEGKDSPAMAYGEGAGYGVLFIIIPFAIAKVIKNRRERKSREVQI